MSPQQENEWLTRKKRIDSRLRDAGWIIAPFDDSKELGSYTNHVIEEYPTENGPADYALVLDGQVIGIVEAKRFTTNPQKILSQAERYSKGLRDSPFDFRGLHTPFIYSTNGDMIRYRDVRAQLNLSRWLPNDTESGLPRDLIVDYRISFDSPIARRAI